MTVTLVLAGLERRIGELRADLRSRVFGADDAAVLGKAAEAARVGERRLAPA